jgi:hypothetical protein
MLNTGEHEAEKGPVNKLGADEQQGQAWRLRCVAATSAGAK